uniref:Protein Wnt n=1 Tax=Panagrolaimus sp. JU765 TaxID=591449 RepID=A0AC34QVI7_9BILA
MRHLPFLTFLIGAKLFMDPCQRPEKPGPLSAPHNRRQIFWKRNRGLKTTRKAFSRMFAGVVASSRIQTVHAHVPDAAAIGSRGLRRHPGRHEPLPGTNALSALGLLPTWHHSSRTDDSPIRISGIGVFAGHVVGRSGLGSGDGLVVEKHNLKAGRLAVKKTLISSCKCHGVSGSCQQKTCWKKTSDMKAIAEHLAEKYKRAKRVTPDKAKLKNAELIYLEPTPDNCAPQLEYQMQQRRSLPRICNWRNETHSEGDCGALCCGKGYKVSHEVISYKCDCKFVWCCKLECNDCLQHRWVSTCNT